MAGEGRRVLARELGRQVLPDGGYAERTPSTTPSCCRTSRGHGPGESRRHHGPGVTPVAAMARWLSRILRPTGRFPTSTTPRRMRCPTCPERPLAGGGAGLAAGPGTGGWDAASGGTARMAKPLPLETSSAEHRVEHRPGGRHELPSSTARLARGPAWARAFGRASYELIWEGARRPGHRRHDLRGRARARLRASTRAHASARWRDRLPTSCGTPSGSALVHGCPGEVRPLPAGGGCGAGWSGG